ncbi:DUF6340 family protein [Cyclobacterium salsum]|uniref:DUF6340 family protein n=1 Tax=Cyclobacterium salsum TaxID=2666329 RepID=UPI001F381FF0|nr:DUF6340 family protein [Cyclobacterium salsum]
MEASTKWISGNSVFFILFFLLLSCTKNVSLTRLMPAEIPVPNHVQRLLLVDRTVPESQGVAIIEGILTGEAPFEIRNAIDATMATIQQELATSPRYEIIRAGERLKGGLFGQVFPEPLSWDQIDYLCDKYQADGVLTLEKFDSDFVVTEKKVTLKKQVGSGNEERTIEVPGILAEGLASVQVGFRLYDPASGTLVDQADFSKTNTWSAEAETKTQALALLIDKVQATRYVGQLAGAAYARRVAPMYVAINRSYYGKSKDNPALEVGARYAEVDQWEDAILAWQDGLSQPSDAKTHGKICYNLALAYEVLGDLPQAKEWAGKAYTQFAFKGGRSYAWELDQRMMEEDQLRQQLASPATE